MQGYARQVADIFGASVTPINLKSQASIIRKLATFDVQHDITRIKDAVRTTIIADADKITELRVYLRIDSIVQRVKVQEGAQFLGYTGTIVNIKCSNGLTAEIQINTPKMIYAKEKPEDAKLILGHKLWQSIYKETKLEGGLGHQYYEKFRLLSIEEQQSELGKSLIKKI